MMSPRFHMLTRWFLCACLACGGHANGMQASSLENERSLKSLASYLLVSRSALSGFRQRATAMPKAHQPRNARSAESRLLAAEPTSAQAGSAVFVSVVIKPDRVKDFLVAMEEDVTKSRSQDLDPGCLRFDLLQDRDTPNKFVFYEVYTDDDAAAFHKTTSHYNAWADFKKSGGVESQEVAKVSTSGIAGDWAFQSKSIDSGPTASAVLVTVVIKEDRIDDFLKAMEDDVVNSREEPGCFRFDLLQDREQPNKFYFYEAYANDEAVAFHKTTPHYKSWADFVDSGGVEAKAPTLKLATDTIEGSWAFQG